MDQPHASATHAEPSVDSEHRTCRSGTDCRPRRQLKIELARSVHEQQRDPDDGGEKADKCGERKATLYDIHWNAPRLERRHSSLMKSLAFSNVNLAGKIDSVLRVS